MAFQNITNLSLGDILQIYYSNGIRQQISEDFADWEYIKRERVGDPMGRQINFYLQTSLGPSAVQRRNPGVVSNFPTAQRVSSQEHTAQIKEIATTVELDYNLWKRAQMSKDVRYAEPLEIEMKSKLIAVKRQLSLELYGTGTGVLGDLAANAGTVSSGDIIFQLDTADDARGFVGWFNYDEILVLKAEDGTATALDTNLATEPAYWKVIDRDFQQDTVTLRGLDSSFAELTVASISVQADAGEVFYKYGQPTIPDLGSISDYGTASEAMPGLESLTADDGRVVHGITMSGATKGTRFDAGNVQLDVTHLESVLNKAKINVGQSAYAWKQAMLAPDAYSQFVNGRESDRRFNSVQDDVRGVRKFVYQHRNDTIDLYSSEFCPKKRMYLIPESRQNQGKVLEYHGTDFMPVKEPNGSDFRLKPSSAGGFENTIVSYMDSYGTLICKHPAAVAVIHNFTVA